MKDSQKKRASEVSDWSEPFIGCDRRAVGGEGLPADWRPDEESGFARIVRTYWPFFAIPVVLSALFVTINGNLDPLQIFWTTAVNTLITGTIGLSIIALYLLTARLIWRSPSRLVRTFWHFVTLALSVVIGAETALLIFKLPFLPNFDISRGDILGVGGVVVGVIWLIEYSYGRLRDRARRVEVRAERAQREALRAQLKALQARTDPHFLFNSLNTVSGLIDENPELADRVVGKLSDLFRYALDGSRVESVTVSREMAMVRAYLEVEALRLGDRLHFEIVSDPTAESLRVPPLVLQPLVENAVLHAVAPREDGGHIWVRAEQHNGRLLLSVEDDGNGPGGSLHAGAGSTLETLRSRLDLLYGPDASLVTGRSVNGGFEVRVEMPARREEGS